MPGAGCMCGCAGSNGADRARDRTPYETTPLRLPAGARHRAHRIRRVCRPRAAGGGRARPARLRRPGGAHRSGRGQHPHHRTGACQRAVRGSERPGCAADARRHGRERPVLRVLPALPPAASAAGSERAARRAGRRRQRGASGRGLGLHHFARRLRADQSSRGRRRRRDLRDADRQARTQGQADRLGPSDRCGAGQDRGQRAAGDEDR